MKYQRMTKHSDLGTLHAYDINGNEQPLCELTAVDTDNLIGRLCELEDKIESGELCDCEEARKETAAKILKSMLNKMYKLTGCGVPYHVKKFMEEIAMEYGVELFENSDRVEDEE